MRLLRLKGLNVCGEGLEDTLQEAFVRREFMYIVHKILQL